MDNLTRLQNRTGEEDEELLRDLLMTAKVAIMNRRFPFKSFTNDERSTLFFASLYEYKILSI